jgi:hypothetical protein
MVADRDALKMEKPKQSVKKGGYPPPLSPGAGEERSAGPSSRFRLGLSGKRGTFRFTTLAEAEHTLQRVANMIVERERSELQQAEIQEERDACKRRGDPTESWPELPPPRGLSVVTGKAIINAINAFIISRRFQDELAEKRRADDLENRLNEALELVARYGKRLEEIVAAQQGKN